MDEQDARHNAEEVIGLYQRFGTDDYIGEPVSQLEHMSQCAQLAEVEGYDEEVILAAFFHDIGHICSKGTGPVGNMEGYGVWSHEKIGADYLRAKGFSERIARLVEGHVQAKRYLTFKYPDYYEKLSEASKRTLDFQGGRMQVVEAREFEANEFFALIIRMRQWDELAKEEYQTVVDLEVFKERCVKHLQNR